MNDIKVMNRAADNIRVLAASMAVSYTHLDVYKRQFFICAWKNRREHAKA